MSLSIRGLTVRYGRRIAVDGLDLEVPDGTITGFLGHNGAGKTSAMRGILGLSPRRAEALRVDGHDARAQPWRVTARTGAVIETTSFQPGWSARRNLVELGRLQGLGAPEARREADRCLELVGLTADGSRRPWQFSQGMRQRLGLAQALLGGRRTLLLDEPTNGLDPEGIAELFRLLRELRDDGVAILLSSHLLGEVESLCDRVVVLREGRLVASGAMKDLRVATGNRYALDCVSLEAAGRVLEGLELTRDLGGDAPWCDLGEAEPSEVLEALVEGGARPRSFGPTGGGLSTVYEAAAEGRLRADSSERPPLETERPSGAAPRATGYWRLLGHELRRHARSAWLLAIPALVALLPVLSLVREQAAARAEVEGQTLFSATEVTAFKAAAEGLRLGLPIAALIALLVSSQLVSGELGRGTLRNVALRPAPRLRLGSAKLTAAALIGVFCAAAALAGAVGGAGAFFEFGDLEEEIMGGQRFPILSADEVLPDFRAALGGGLAAVLGFSCLGFGAGALVGRGVAGVGVSLGAFLFLTVARWFSAGGDLEWLNPATYLPFLAADASRVHALAILAGGATNVPFEYSATEFAVPLGLALVSGALGVAMLLRRRIP